jgi:hypothetical protein
MQAFGRRVRPETCPEHGRILSEQDRHMDILALWYLLIALIAAIGVGGGLLLLRPEHLQRAEGQPTAPCRRVAMILTLALLVSAAGTIIWGEIALRHFARELDGNIRGMIGGPVPYGGGDHQYTPRGQHYERWIFQIPVTAGFTTLLLTLGFGVVILYRLGHRIHLVGAILWTFAMAGTIVIWAVTRFFCTFEVFI